VLRHDRGGFPAARRTEKSGLRALARRAADHAAGETRQTARSDLKVMGGPLGTACQIRNPARALPSSNV
jgi:hypothetical protein